MPKVSKQRKNAAKHDEIDAASPFTYKVVARKDPNKRGEQCPSLTVTLSIPRDDDECPLTLDTIKESKLAFLPETVFSEAKPLHSKITLPCRHSFHALSLLYNWCKNGMLCPCCRAGHQEQADPACLPKHFQAPMADRVKDTLSTERESDMPDLMAQIYGVTVPFSTLSHAGCLTMVMSFLESVDSPDPLFVFSARMDESGGTEARPVFGPRSHFPSISNILRMGVRAVQLQVRLDVPEAGSFCIDACGPLAIVPGTTSSPGEHRQVHRTGVMMDGVLHLNSSNEHTRFEVSAAEGRQGLAISGIRWYPEGQYIELLSAHEE